MSTGAAIPYRPFVGWWRTAAAAMIPRVTDENPRRWADRRKPDPDNSGFRKAIDNIFKQAAERAKEQAQASARRGRKARKRTNDAEDRQKRRKSDR
jgi:hypothetical protein